MVTAKYHGHRLRGPRHRQLGEISEADPGLEEDLQLAAQVAIIVYSFPSLRWPPTCAGGEEILKEVMSIMNWVAYL
jgi:hypothetical protein